MRVAGISKGDCLKTFCLLYYQQLFCVDIIRIIEMSNVMSLLISIILLLMRMKYDGDDAQCYKRHWVLSYPTWSRG